MQLKPFSLRYLSVKRALFILTLLFSTSLPLLPLAASAAGQEVEPSSPGFPVGEVLIYRLKWGAIPVGTARISSEWTTDTPPAIRMRVHVRSNAFLDRFYRIDDIVESVTDPATMLSLRFEKHMREGRSEQHDVTTFDRANSLVLWSNVLTGATREYTAPPDVRDILAIMFSLRSTTFSAGEQHTYVIAGDNDAAPVEITVTKERNYKTDRYGAIPALYLQPKVGPDALFLGRTPRDLWISVGMPHILLLLSVEAPIGRISLILDAIEGADEWPLHP